MSARARTAVVTGGTSGIGLATTRALVRDGWWVLAVGLSHHEDLVTELAVDQAGDVLAIDITSDHAPRAIIGRAVARNGALSLLVNNAGIYRAAPIVETDGDLLDRIFAVNVCAATLIAAEAVRAMRVSGGGVIVNVGSEAGVAAIPNQVAYNMSKAAIAMLTRSIAVDHAADGIRAVTVSPGTTRTPPVQRAIQSASDPVQHEHTLTATRPARRLGEPSEIAELIAFISSDRAPYMTGCDVLIDGGLTAQ